MEGYDVTLLGSFYGYPRFREKYGEYLDKANGHQISANWQQRFNCLGALANIIGALVRFVDSESLATKPIHKRE